MMYAGFWKRLVALLIDSLLLYVVSLIVGVVLGGVLLVALSTSDVPIFYDDNATFLLSLMVSVILACINMVIQWLYFALMESSAKQATLGKMALGIKVTDLNGERIGFGRATGRYFGKIISGFILAIGFIMAAFTEKKQGLHDLMASCLVINKDKK